MRSHHVYCYFTYMRRWSNASLMLAQRLRRWPKIKLTTGQRLIFGIIWRIFIEGRWGERREKEGGETAKKK